MKYLINALLVLALAVFTIQCEVVSDDLLDNPNAPSPENASPDFLLNNALLGTVSFYGNISTEAEDLIRMTHFFGPTYPNGYQAQFFDSEWNTAYAGVLIDIQTLIPRAQDRELFVHEGIARVLRAYVLMNLVDRFGDVPFSEALDPTNFNPVVDSGSDVYDIALAELDSARIALNKTSLALPGNDLIYDGDAEKWITLANTLELRALYNQRLVEDNTSRINALLDGDVIRASDQAFLFQYGTNPNNPDTRHPDFTGNYLTGASDYMANYYMNELWQDKSDPDPRIRYYLYRQTDEPTDDVNEQDCINNPPPSHYEGNGNGSGLNDPFCEDWNNVGYWGRDHGNSDGIPPDNLLRTVYGVYPAGGRFDADQAEGVAEDQGLQGAGIRGMWLPFYTDFVEAEVELTVNNDPGAARTALENAIRGSINFVIDFGADAVAAETNGASFVPSQTEIDNYVNEVLDRWDNQAANDQERLWILGKEYYLALFGNGVEAYNLYRRIAPPKENPWWNLQPALSPNPGQFYNSIIYPSAFFERNSNASQKDAAVKVFWMGDNDPSFGNF